MPTYFELDQASSDAGYVSDADIQAAANIFFRHNLDDSGENLFIHAIS